MKRFLVCGLLHILPLCIAASAAAQQQRLFAKTATEMLELDTNINSFGAVLRRFPLPPGSSGGGTVALAGGRYLAWG